MGLVGLGFRVAVIRVAVIRVVVIRVVGIRGSRVGPAVGSRVGLGSLGRRRRLPVLWRFSGEI